MTTLTITKKNGETAEVSATTVQAPPAKLGQHTLNGIPMIASQIDVNQSINPATGAPYVQVGPRQATQISPPPSRRFDGR
jgi:hypothetical protein